MCSGDTMGRSTTVAVTVGKSVASIIDLEAPIHLSNLAPVCSHCDRGVRIGSRLLDEVKRYPNGRERRQRARFCKRCGELI